MTYNDGNWTDEKPEVGKRYWLLTPGRQLVTSTFYEHNVAAWVTGRAWAKWLRSVSPVVELTPPPLPSKETR